MSNYVNGNPIVCDTFTSDVAIGDTKILLIQWIDDNGDLAHDSIFSYTVNGFTVNVQIQPLADKTGFGGVAYQLGPFSAPVSVNDLTIESETTGGMVVVWQG